MSIECGHKKCNRFDRLHFVVDDVVDDVVGVIGVVVVVGVVGVTRAANSDDDIARVDVAAAALARETRSKSSLSTQFDIKITRRWRARSTPHFVLLSL